MLMSASRRKNRRSFKLHNQPITKSQRKTQSSLCPGGAAEARHCQPGRADVAQVTGTRGRAGAQQKPEAFLGQREAMAGKGAEGREAGMLLLQSDRAEPHALIFYYFFPPFDWLLNLLTASYCSYKRRKTVAARLGKAVATTLQQTRTRAPCCFKAQAQQPRCSGQPTSATARCGHDQGGLIASL